MRCDQAAAQALARCLPKLRLAFEAGRGAAHRIATRLDHHGRKGREVPLPCKPDIFEASYEPVGETREVLAEQVIAALIALARAMSCKRVTIVQAPDEAAFDRIAVTCDTDEEAHAIANWFGVALQAVYFDRHRWLSGTRLWKGPLRAAVDIQGRHQPLPGIAPLKPWRTCAEALGHLDGEAIGRPVKMRRRAQNGAQLAVPTPGCASGHATTTREWPWPRPATTVTPRAGLAPPGHHDAEFAVMSLPDALLLSERAATILQGFPEDWHFAGATKRARWSQIGQAMPPALAEAVARAIVDQHAATPRLAAAR